MELLRKLVSALIERSTGDGKLITPLLEWEVDFAMRYCCTLRVVPFHWDPVIRQLSLVHTQSYEHKAWTTLAILSLLHCGLMWLRFYVSILNGDSLVTLTLVFFSVVVLCVPSTCQVIIYIHASEVADFLNVQMLLFKKIEQLYWRPGAPPFGKFMEFVIGCMILGSLTHAYLMVLFYWYKPFAKMFLLSSTFLDENSSSILMFLAALHVYWFVTHGWATTLFFIPGFLQFSFFLIFITKNISANYRGSQTLDTLRIPRVAFKIYSSLRLLTQRMNRILHSAIFIIVNLDLVALVVGNNLLITFHSSLSTLLFATIGSCSVIVGVILIVMYVMLGEVHHSSKAFVRSWIVKQDYPVHEKKLLLKLFKSCRLNRIEMGSMGSFKKPTVIRICGKIVLYTVKLLLLLRPYSSTLG